MSINLALFILILLIALYLSFIEIFTVLFMITGMSHTRSRFQVISLLTNSGFTTNESEVVVSSRKRRKLAIVTMIFGHIFNVAIVSLLVNVIMSFSNDGNINIMPSIINIVVFLILLYTFKRLPFMRVSFDKLVKRLANKIMFDKNSNPLLILDNFNGFVIAEVKIIDVPEKLRNKTLLQSGISLNHGIRILVIKRNDQTIGDITKEEIILNNDRLIIFGALKSIVEVFKQQPSL
ncbi:MAG: TrkA C-terminal domain-containing protein [Hyphomonadaceae bacterium]|nr:TrkA C-terminal domain-containing protein [Clostridia bacterium]